MTTHGSMLHDILRDSGLKFLLAESWIADHHDDERYPDAHLSVHFQKSAAEVKVVADWLNDYVGNYFRVEDHDALLATHLWCSLDPWHLVAILDPNRYQVWIAQELAY